MGMFNAIFVLDTLELRCSGGHVLRSLHTKDLAQPVMSTYLLCAGRLYLARPELGVDDEDATGWHIQAGRAIHERRFELRDVPAPQCARLYASCPACEPVLVRSDVPDIWGDIVREHAVLVDFRLTLRPGEPPQIERVSGTRDELKDQLRARGVFVLEDDDALAVAHGRLKQARDFVHGSAGERVW